MASRRPRSVPRSVVHNKSTGNNASTRSAVHGSANFPLERIGLMYSQSHVHSVYIESHDPLRQTYSRDVLDVRPHYFTQPHKPFVPRTLKTNHESRLRHSKCYNPARNVNIESSPQRTSYLGTHFVSQKKHRPGRCVSSDDNTKTLQPLAPQWMDMAGYSPHDYIVQQASHYVPTVAMSRYKDTMTCSNGTSRPAPIPEGTEGNSELQKPMPQVKQLLEPSDVHSCLREAIKMELLRRDEENKYLMFAREVTDDLVSRGNYSDSVLLRVCKTHIQNRRNELETSRMQVVVSDLLRNIGLQDTSSHQESAASISEAHHWPKSLETLSGNHSSSGYTLGSS